MSEYLKDSGHHDMRTCDSCGGAFYAGRGPSDAEEEWTCDTCEEKDAEIARLRAALKPFADLARDWVRCANETGVSDECAIVRSVPSGINVGNCRALLKALGDK